MRQFPHSIFCSEILQNREISHAIWTKAEQKTHNYTKTKQQLNIKGANLVELDRKLF